MRRGKELQEPAVEDVDLVGPEGGEFIPHGFRRFFGVCASLPLGIEVVREADDPLFKSYRRHVPFGEGEALGPDVLDRQADADVALADHCMTGQTLGFQDLPAEDAVADVWFGAVAADAG